MATSPALHILGHLYMTNNFQISEHFNLRELSDHNDHELVVVHPLLIGRLEQLRTDLNKRYEDEIEIVITCGTRTINSNNKLALTLGWTEEGGLVSRTSMHMPHNGGCACDLFARFASHKTRIDRIVLAHLASASFDTVISKYKQHIHVDLRKTLGITPHEFATESDYQTLTHDPRR